jgi:hypothetical protein
MTPALLWTLLIGCGFGTSGVQAKPKDAVAPPAPVQEATKVEVPCAFSTGQTVRYERRILATSHTTISVVDVEVIGPDTIVVTTVSTDAVPKKGPFPPGTEAVLEQRTPPITLVFDHKTRALSIKEPEKLAGQLKADLQALVEREGEAVAASATPVLALFDDIEAITRMLSEPYRSLVSFSCLSLTPGEDTSFTEVMPDPMGGAALVAQRTVRSKPPVDGAAEISVSVSLDEKSNELFKTALLDKLMVAVPEDQKADVTKAIGQTKIGIERSEDVVLDLASALPRSITSEKAIFAGPMSRNSNEEWKQVPIVAPVSAPAADANGDNANGPPAGGANSANGE